MILVEIAPLDVFAAALHMDADRAGGGGDKDAGLGVVSLPVGAVVLAAGQRLGLLEAAEVHEGIRIPEKKG